MMEKKNVQPWQQYQALYLHIPFCVQKCLYCDFASYAGFGEQAKRAYTDAVCREIALRAAEAANMAADASIYFGGGTPSVLPTECIAKLVKALKQYGFWQQPREATIEVNPGTADLAKLQTLHSLGFDRISFGVQSLQDSELQAIGRIHNAQQALEALQLAKAAGFERISADLIYGLPSQTMASLQDTLERLADTGIEHVSVYGLIVEEGTPLASLADKGRITLPDEDTAADMYELVQSFLRERGFERYEISNYAKNGQYSRHNTVYWEYRPYMAFGAAACGFDGQMRLTGLSTVKEYIGQLQSFSGNDLRASALYNVEELSCAELLEEFMFMGLRRSEGASLAEARERFGVEVLQRFASELAPLFEQKLIAYDASTQRLRLTERGMEVGNQIFEVFVIS